MIVPNQEQTTLHFQNEQTRLHENAQMLIYKSHVWNSVPHELPAGYYNCNLIYDDFDVKVTFSNNFFHVRTHQNNQLLENGPSQA